MRGARVPLNQAFNHLDSESSLNEFLQQDPAADSEVALDSLSSAPRRQPGALAGRIRIAPDFDQLPVDIAAAFGSGKLSRAKPR
ncbi:MAG TPA: hypothetical protein DCY80_20590 [Solibacterales bacterium]|nr:hypothetical protein [Bryobacterales bacterium]